MAAFITLFSCKEKEVYNEEPVLENETTIEVAPDTSMNSLQELKNIEDIKTEYSYIFSKVKNENLESTSFNYNCNGEKKGTVKYFYENGELVMIRHSYNEYSHFSATDEYFIKDGDPFFIFYNHTSWNFTENDQTKDEVTEKRFYILNNELVQCLQKEFIILSDDEDSPTSNSVANKEINCPSIGPILEEYRKILEFKNRTKELDCL